MSTNTVVGILCNSSLRVMSLSLSLRAIFCSISFFPFESAKYLGGKRYYGGGTLAAYTSTHMLQRPREVLHERLEDGTANFLSILALKVGEKCV